MNLHMVRVTFLILLLISFFNIAASAQTLRGKYIVIVDAAHGGSDEGVKLSDKYSEKDATLAIASMLKKEMDTAGNIQIYLLRMSDNNLSSSDRIKAVKHMNADMFIQIHVNAGFGKDSSGYELYFPAVTPVAAVQVNSKDILHDMAKNKHLNDSVRFAQLIQRNLESVFPRKSRGITNAPFVILSGLTMPAVIMEIGFATNHDDKKKIMDTQVQNAVAHAIGKSIREYF